MSPSAASRRQSRDPIIARRAKNVTVPILLLSKHRRLYAEHNGMAHDQCIENGGEKLRRTFFSRISWQFPVLSPFPCNHV
jgi:hypothetical protein